MNPTESPHFSKALRRDLAAIFAGIAFASFVCSGDLWSRFMKSQPRNANPTLGLFYPMNNHGWIYYLSVAQITQMKVLVYIAFAFFLLATAIKPPEPTKKPWEMYAHVAQLPWKFFWGSLVLSFGILWLTSPHLASFLVSKGIIL
jgi:hypothetical protein